jgi:hypothetical protein
LASWTTLITSTAGVLTEAAARKGHIDHDIMQRLAPALEAIQVVWSRAAKRWGELTSPASRTDPTLVGAAGEVRAAIAAAATNPTGWATADQLASRLNLPKTVKILHLSMVASIEIAYVVRDTAPRQVVANPGHEVAHEGSHPVQRGNVNEAVAWAAIPEGRLPNSPSVARSMTRRSMTPSRVQRRPGAACPRSSAARYLGPIERYAGLAPSDRRQREAGSDVIAGRWV